MDNSISDYLGDSNSYRSCQNVNNGTDYSIESNEFVYPRKSGTVERYQLVEEHGTLSQAFLYEASVPRYQQYDENLEQKLSVSKEIWSQSEWVARLECLFCCDEFRKGVLDIVEFFGNELKMCMDGTPPKGPNRSNKAFNFNLPQVIHHSFSLKEFQLLRSVHALWKDDAMVTMPSELKEAKINQNFAQISCSLEDIAKLLDTDMAKLKENDIGQWLQVIRERGYNLLGLCAHIQGAFSELLGSSSINDAIMENLGCMEFWHVSKLIDLVLIPLLKYCPCELLGERILKLLPPLFKYYCEDIFCCAWFDLLNTGRAGYCHYFGYPQGSEESVKKLEDYILLDLTRKVSKLLRVLASLEPKDALIYALSNNCFGMLKMNLLGSWVDGEATLDAVPFFHALVQVAVATNNRKVRRFIVDDMLPATIKRLCDGLSCTVQQTIGKLSSELNSSKSKKASEDLLVLCEEIYKVYIQSQDFTSQDLDNENIGDRFKDWLARQKQDLLAKASCAIPEHFPDNLWNWEFEDEFQRYLPTYIDILYEVDAMDYVPEYDYSCCSTLIEKLRPEFRLKHDINSLLDRHVRMIDKMVQRKLLAEYPKRRSHQMDKWLCKLITTKPYLKNSYDRNSAVALLMEDLTIDAKLSHLDVLDAIDMFYNAILFYLEPQFHPLIREGHKNFLIKIAHQFIFAEETNCYEPLEPESEDFPGYLQPHASSYIYRMKIESKYSEAREQVCLHQEFDEYLAAGELDDHIYRFNSSQDKSVQEFSDKYLARSQFGKLDSKLIILSLQERGQIVDMQHQIDTYSENLRNILANVVLKDYLEKLMNELEEERFFDVDNDSTDWGKTCFVSLIEKFKALVFEGHYCPQYAAVQGIMEYWRISKRSDIAAQVDLEKVVEVVCSRWKKNIAELWMDTRYYEESCYNFIRNPLKKILPRKDEPQNYDKPPTMVG